MKISTDELKEIAKDLSWNHRDIAESAKDKNWFKSEFHMATSDCIDVLLAEIKRLEQKCEESELIEKVQRYEKALNEIQVRWVLSPILAGMARRALKNIPRG